MARRKINGSTASAPVDAKAGAAAMRAVRPSTARRFIMGRSFSTKTGGGGPGLGVQRRVDDCAILGEDGGLDDFIIPLRTEGCVLTRQQGEKRKEVAGVEGGGVGGDAAGEVG